MAAISSAGPREIASSASFWLLLKRASRLVNPTFNQILRRLSLYCYDVPTRDIVADLRPDSIEKASGAFCSLFYFHQPHLGMTKCSGRQ
jgi:hypothetical protein